MEYHSSLFCDHAWLPNLYWGIHTLKLLSRHPWEVSSNYSESACQVCRREDAHMCDCFLIPILLCSDACCPHRSFLLLRPWEFRHNFICSRQHVFHATLSSTSSVDCPYLTAENALHSTCVITSVFCGGPEGQEHFTKHNNIFFLF